MSLVGTGRFDIQQAVSGVDSVFYQTQADYFGDATSAASYPAGTIDGYNKKTNTSDPNLHEFGFISQEVIIVNEGSNDIVFQADVHWGTNHDSGVVKANSTLILRNKRCRGIKVRSRTSASAYFIMAH